LKQQRLVNNENNLGMDTRNAAEDDVCRPRVVGICRPAARSRLRLLSEPPCSRLVWRARPLLFLADPHTSPGYRFQETPYPSEAEEEAGDQHPKVRSEPAKRARRPHGAHKTDDAGCKEEDAEYKAEDS
jgi:hypothetical protein